MLSYLAGNDQSGTSNLVTSVVLLTTVVVSSSLLSSSINEKKQKQQQRRSWAPTPPIVPSYVPFLGPAGELLKLGFGEFAKKYSREFNNSPIVSAKVAGVNIHFIVEPAAFPAIFRNNPTDLSMGPAIAEIGHTLFGMSKKGLSIFNDDVRKRNMDALHNHVLKSNGLGNIIENAQQEIHEQLSVLLGDSTGRSTTTLDLHDMVRKTIFYATLRVAISKSECVVNDEFIRFFDIFEEAIPKAFYGLPIKYVAHDSYKAREELVKIFQSDEFVPSAYLQERRCFLSSLGMSADDIARDDLYWTSVACTNLIPSHFWHIYYIACNPNAFHGIRQEVDNVIAARKQKKEDRHQQQHLPFDGTFTMEELDSMVGLESAYKESNRLSSTILIGREVMRDMEIDLRLKKKPSKYFLSKGSRIALYPPLLHQDPSVFENPKDYVWDRFLVDSTTGKSPTFTNSQGEVIHDPFRTFGGGAHHCPGRKLASNIAKCFAANLVYSYDMEVIGGGEYPIEFDMSRDGFGVLRPKTNVTMRFTPRKK